MIRMATTRQILADEDLQVEEDLLLSKSKKIIETMEFLFEMDSINRKVEKKAGKDKYLQILGFAHHSPLPEFAGDRKISILGRHSSISSATILTFGSYLKAGEIVDTEPSVFGLHEYYNVDSTYPGDTRVSVSPPSGFSRMLSPNNSLRPKSGVGVSGERL